MEYIVETRKLKENHAGVKAPSDIVQICKKRGMATLSIPGLPVFNNKIFLQFWLLFHSVSFWLSLFFKLKDGDKVFWQHPTYGTRYAIFFIPKLKKYRKIEFVAIIHDLETLRYGVKGFAKVKQSTSSLADLKLLKYFDYVISHNEKMSEYLIETGISQDKIRNIDIFDYLIPENTILKTRKNDKSIIIAGNLSSGKSGYLYELMKSTVDLNLYGVYFEGDSNDKVYKGAFEPDELVSNLEGAFGLVWDGESIESCLGNTGNYLRYNNPHKTSLYLASGIPVIVWSEAAIADFVIKNQIGVVIDNLEKLPHVLSNIPDEEYQKMLENVSVISNNLQNGYYTNKAIETCK